MALATFCLALAWVGVSWAGPVIEVWQGTGNSNYFYDFGDVAVGTGPRTTTFTIKNSGDADLVLNGNPVSWMDGWEANRFEITSQPASTTISAGSETAFQVSYGATASGICRGYVVIPNNANGAYYLRVRGFGLTASPPFGPPVFDALVIDSNKFSDHDWFNLSAEFTGPGAYDAMIHVTDPTGQDTCWLNDIYSGYDVFFDDQYGNYRGAETGWELDADNPPPTGNYHFEIRDSAGRTSEQDLYWEYNPNLPDTTELVPQAPANNSYVGTTTPTLIFQTNATGGPFWYRVAIKPYNGGDGIYFSERRLLSQGETYTEPIPSGVLQPNTPYRWDIYAQDVNSRSRNYTHLMESYFYTGTQATGAWSIENAMVLSFLDLPSRRPVANFLFKLPGVAPWDIHDFKLFVDYDDGGGGGPVPLFETPMTVQTWLTDSCRYSMGTLVGGGLGNGDYTIKVKDNTEAVAASQTLSFTYNPIDPVDESTVTPVHNAYLDTTTPTVSWGAVPGAGAYLVRLTPLDSGVILYTSPWIEAPDTSFTFPEGLMKQDATYRVLIFAFDSSNQPRNMGMPLNALYYNTKVTEWGDQSSECYMPGDTVDIDVTLNYTQDLTWLAMTETIPDGWTLVSVSGPDQPAIYSQPNSTSAEFGWISIPESPVEFTFTLQTPGDASGTYSLGGEMEFRVGAGSAQRMPAGGVYLSDNCYHNLDFDDHNWEISLLEILRGVQLYNAGQFHCEPDPGLSDDGYAPGEGDTSCLTHHLDYNPQDWIIELTELGRGVQFYNVGAYHRDPAGEDGFNPGTAAPDSGQSAPESTGQVTASYTVSSSSSGVVVANHIEQDGNLTFLGYRVTLPDGWTFQSVGGTSPPVITPKPGATGTLEFAWIDIPGKVVEFTIEATLSEGASAQATLAPTLLYRTMGPELYAEVTNTAATTDSGSSGGGSSASSGGGCFVGTLLE